MSIVLYNYFHIIGYGMLLSAVVLELFLYRQEVGGALAGKLARIDAFLGAGALILLATGLLKVFDGDKPAVYYGHNFIFHIKVTLFALAVILSILPTVQFLKKRRTPADETVQYSKIVAPLMWIELACLLAIPLLAVMMSRGYGVR